MVLLGFALLLAASSVAVFPCWRHSQQWGYTPSVTAGILLFCLAIMTVGGKPANGFVRTGATTVYRADGHSVWPYAYSFQPRTSRPYDGRDLARSEPLDVSPGT
ncbi:Protein of unknown function [Enhydrobacter aerosaccus]|uniref:DUF3309 domain-containing protein n=1 Tax=Enhydrobacter aerosaccus TaxID=225324 RepID=A0A1T4PR39_9HYPH|nr:DUF3309 family protein [Enhydrobacter aerosaccus]SJZ94005.1 Protein of unknown function [Enhydrobacter aerosaccus]